MLNYMLADLTRILRRIPRWILLLLLLAVDVLFVYPSDSSTMSGAETARLFGSFMSFMPVVIGFIEILYVFADDFKGKTAQIAIGLGVSRRHVVLSKWFEVIFLAFLDIILITAVAFATTIGTKAAFPPELYNEIAVYSFMCLVSTSAYMAMVLPILFWSQGTTLAMLVYILLSSGLVHKLISLLGQIDELVDLHLANLTLTNCLNVLRTRLILGNLHMESIIGILLYVSVSLVLAFVLYQKKELDF